METAAPAIITAMAGATVIVAAVICATVTALFQTRKLFILPLKSA